MTAQLKIRVAVVALAALLTPVASGREAKNTVFKGELVGIEPSFGSSNAEITVKILDGSRWGRGAEGRIVTFIADDDTRIRVPDRDGDGQAELSDLQPNDGLQLIARVAEDEEYHGDVELNALSVTWAEWGK